MGKVLGVLLGVALCAQASPVFAEEQPAAPALGEATPAAPEPPPPPRPTRDRNAGARVGLLVGGSVAFGVFYGLPCAGGGGLWCVPFAGPVLVVAKNEREYSQSADANEDGIVPPAFVYTLAGSLGMLQLTGAALIAAGALLPRREVSESARGLTLLPLVSSSAAGVAALGTW